jgi:hypothetical protein
MAAMENRKLFRMRHEPCAGRCYAPDEVLALHELGTDVSALADLLADLVKIHAPACGQEQIGFALDHSADAGVFIAVFSHFGAVTTYAHASPVECLRQMVTGVQAWYATEEAAALLAEHPGDKDACEHGHDEDLVSFALEHSGLPDAVQGQLRQQVFSRLAA